MATSDIPAPDNAALTGSPDATPAGWAREARLLLEIFTNAKKLSATLGGTWRSHIGVDLLDRYGPYFNILVKIDEAGGPKTDGF